MTNADISLTTATILKNAMLNYLFYSFNRGIIKDI